MIILWFLPKLRIEDIVGIPRIPSSYNPQDNASYERLVKERQALLASRFCNLMTKEMLFTSHNDHRLGFYKDVLNKVNFHVLRLFS